MQKNIKLIAFLLPWAQLQLKKCYQFFDGADLARPDQSAAALQGGIK